MVEARSFAVNCVRGPWRVIKCRMGRTVIGPGTKVIGPLEGDDDLEIHGTVEGPVRGKATVTIGATARVGGEVRGHIIILEGHLAYPLIATATVRLTKTAELRADITAPRIAIDEGAVFEGQVRMVAPTVTAPTVTAPMAPTVSAPVAPTPSAGCADGELGG